MTQNWWEQDQPVASQRGGLSVPPLSQAMPPQPNLPPTMNPIQIRNTEATTAHTNLQNNIDRATAPDQIRKAKADADMAAFKLQQEHEKQNAFGALDENAAEALRNQITNARQARSILDSHPYITTGPLGQVAQHLWGSPAADLGAALDAIRNGVAVNALQKMREENPQGGLGFRVTQGEIQMLGNSIAPLHNNQSAQDLRKSIDRHEQLATNALYKLKAGEHDFAKAVSDRIKGGDSFDNIMAFVRSTGRNWDPSQQQHLQGLMAKVNSMRNHQAPQQGWSIEPAN
jgi:hypothetical protein